VHGNPSWDTSSSVLDTGTEHRFSENPIPPEDLKEGRVYELLSKTRTGAVSTRTGDWGVSGMVPSPSMRTILISPTDGVKGAVQRLHVFDSVFGFH
jgi:hypothetical protein